MVGYIKKGKATAEHKAALEARGYKVTDEGDFIAIECNGFVTSEFEATSENLQALVRDKKLLTYKTPCRFGEKVYTGIFACGQLGSASALVAKTSKTSSKVKLDW